MQHSRRPPAAQRTTPPFFPAKRAVGAAENFTAENFGGKKFLTLRRFCSFSFVIIYGIFYEPFWKFLQG
jgi:hypothetical protein